MVSRWWQIVTGAGHAAGVQAGWDESLVITGTDPAQVEDVDDDLARELAFYNQVRHHISRASCIAAGTCMVCSQGGPCDLWCQCR